MSSRNRSRSWDAFEVLGTTTVSNEGDLPRRLSPIYRLRDDDETLYLPMEEERGARPLLAAEAATYLAELVEQGQAVVFGRPFPARPAHCLVQVASGAHPEYLPVDELHARPREARDDALRRAAQALADGDREEATAATWYARRADPDDPLPLLVLIALLRGSLEVDEVRLLEEDLAEHPPTSVADARRRAQEQRELAAIRDLLSSA